MEALFLKVFGMSVTGSIVILITLLARLLLKKRSKRFIMILWAFVAVRLLIPIGFDSSFSIFNFIPLQTQTFTAAPQVKDAAIPDKRAYINIDEETGDTGTAAMSEDPGNAELLPDTKTVLSLVWLAGAMGIAGICFVRYIRLKKKLENAKNVSGNVYVSEKISTPFVFGLFVPRIYLPDVLEKTEKEYILLHEKTHIKHGDWLIKIIGMTAVAVHWFNPLVWLAYMFFERDIEMSCDESVVAGLNDDLKQAYTMSIVSYAQKSNSKRYLVTPLGFSKVNFSKTEVTNRVKNIINFKKGRTATAIAITAALIIVGGACIPNSKTNADEAAVVTETTEETKVTESTKEEKETAEPSETTAPSETTEATEATETEETSETTAPAETTKVTEVKETKNANKPFETEATEPDGPKSDYDLKPGTAKYAKNFVGIPYVKGGDSKKGFDNMGFVKYLYFQLYSAGIPEDYDKLLHFGQSVSKSQAQVSDIVCFSEGDKKLIAFYVGDGKAIYASPKEGKVVCKDLSAMKVKSIRHLIDY